MSLRQAEVELGVPRLYLTGFLEGRRISVRKVGGTLIITGPILDRLRREIPPKRKKSKRRRIAAPANQ